MFKPSPFGEGEVLKLPSIGYLLASTDLPMGTHCTWYNPETKKDVYGLLEAIPGHPKSRNAGSTTDTFTMGLDHDPSVTYTKIKAPVLKKDGIHVKKA